MIRVKVPATSANLGVGFDTLGIALELYNEFEFEINQEDDVTLFEKSFQKDNLILKSYKYFFEYFNLNYIPVKIKQVVSNVPVSRGLGSSATAIVAGILAANYFSKKEASFSELLSIASNIEGHPDNVLPALVGGFTGAYYSKEIKYNSFEFSDKLNIYLLIPNFIMSTSKSREVLPKEYKINDIVNNLSRIVFLPKAFELGDMKLIRDATVDSIHEPYRLPLIPNATRVIEKLENEHRKILLSGSGSTLIMFTDEDLSIDEILGFKVVKTKIERKGGCVYEI